MLSHVTHHSAILPRSTRKMAPKSNRALRPDGGNGPSGPCWVPSYVAQTATKFPSATRCVIVCTESGNTAASCRIKSLNCSRLRTSTPGVASQWRTTSRARRSSSASSLRLFMASQKRRTKALFCSLVVPIVVSLYLLSRLLGATVGEQLHRAPEVGEEYRNLLAL